MTTNKLSNIIVASDNTGITSVTASKVISSKKDSINLTAKQSLISSAKSVQVKTNQLLKLLSQNRLDSKKLGSQTALKQQLNSLENKLTSICKKIDEAIINKT